MMHNNTLGRTEINTSTGETQTFIRTNVFCGIVVSPRAICQSFRAVTTVLVVDFPEYGMILDLLLKFPACLNGIECEN